MEKQRLLELAGIVKESDDSDDTLNNIFRVLESSKSPEDKLAKIQQIIKAWVEADPFLT